MAEKEADRLGKGSAAELLSTWRGAERDRVAAEETAGVAILAAAASRKAQEAAAETADAARLSLEAAQRAQRAAHETAEAAGIAARTATRELSAAKDAVETAQATEARAREAFQSGQEKGFPKDS